MDKRTRQLLESLLPATKNAEEQQEFERQVMQYANQTCYETALRDPIARIPRA